MGRLLNVQESHPLLQQKLQLMSEKLAIKRTMQNKSWLSVFRSRDVRNRTMLAIGVLSFQQLTGAKFFFCYGTTVFAATGFSDSYIIQVIMGGVNCLCTLPGLYFEEQRPSHQKCLTIGALCIRGWFLIFASLGHFCLQHGKSENPAAGPAMIVFIILFIAAFLRLSGALRPGEIHRN